MSTVENKVKEANLVILSKFEKFETVPKDHKRLCLTHYYPKKEEFEGYEVVFSTSTIPNIWCEECSPAKDYFGSKEVGNN